MSQRVLAPARKPRLRAGREPARRTGNPQGGLGMKRTAGAFTLLAALGGCMSTEQRPDLADHFGQPGHAKEIAGAVGPWGQPVAVGANGLAVPSDNVTPVSVRGSGSSITAAGDGGVQQTGYMGGVMSSAAAGVAMSHVSGGHKGQIP